MEDSGDSASDVSEAVLAPFDEDELPHLLDEVVEDQTNEVDEVLSDDDSPASLILDDGTPAIKPRPYQLEMVEESLSKNIIIAMDTGSGKTHCAVMRMQYELERILPGQLIWFLAPTVSLCEQQFEYIKCQITSVQIRFLSGADGVDRWTDKSLWDSILSNVGVVVSTYQILADALTHGFVKIAALALIIFDEAHNCVGKQAGAKLMQNFYHKRKAQGLAVPHMLGLTASPVMRSDPLSVTKIEETLDAICRTPTKHREELRLQVKLPVLSHVTYQPLIPESSLGSYTKTIESLGQAFRNLKLSDDPYVMSLREENTDRSRRKLGKIQMNHKTWCQDQMKSFHATTLKICSELGAWAADCYISQVVAKVTKSAEKSGTSLGIWDITNAEKQYLAKTLMGVDIAGLTASQTPASIPLVTDKLRKLIETLVRKSKLSGTFSAIVFVQERALAAVLAHLLSVHPETRDLFCIGTIVGASAHSNRTRNMRELIDIELQKNALSLFKSGRINLVIATSVLEEGIDVPACNLVVCFQKPYNLKSFVQRRGRARHRDSELVLLLESTDKTTEWHQLEQAMRKIYEDEMRVLQEILLREDTEEHGNRTFEVPSTGALLDFDSVVAHLYHFCATLPRKEYADLRPEFDCYETGGLVRARVILPLSVNEKVRTAESKSSWLSEKNAIKDAAFVAYVALYHAGLISDHLLPLLRHDPVTDELTSSTVEKRASIVSVRDQMNPWNEVARAWEKLGDGAELYHTTINVGDLVIQTCLPVSTPYVSPFHVYWDAQTSFLVVISGSTSKTTTKLSSSSLSNPEVMSKVWSDTWTLLHSAFGSRFSIKQQRVVMPFFSNIDISGMQKRDHQPVTAEIRHNSEPGLIRDVSELQVKYIFRKFLLNKPPIESVQDPYENYDVAPAGPHLSLKRLPRRFDFLHKVLPGNDPPSKKSYSTVLPLERCTEDSIPFRFMQFGLLIPSIMHRVGVFFLAKTLSETLLKDIEISDLSLIVTAISASSANEATNYQRLEFLGDSILKTCTSVQLMATYPLWHEGYLSAKKDRLVSNSRLSRAAIEAGLDSFIITKPFTGNKWRPIYIEDILEADSDASRRELSTKVLADVVEALIGASMLNGGIPKALKCLQVFLPELEWKSLDTRRTSIFERAPDAELPTTLLPLERLIGYTFKKKALLTEAMTHASSKSGSQSLERLEFLGDAVLDYVVLTAMYPHELSHVEMHHLRTSLVNADFLAYICLEWHIEDDVVILEPDSSALDKNGLPKFKKRIKKKPLPLRCFLRHASPRLGTVQQETSDRHAELRSSIIEAFERGTHYPWALLARLKAPKFFSDMVESLLGAIWIDSGSFETCTEVVERMGILPYFRRILKDGVDTLHPKEALGMLADTESVRYVIYSRRRKVDDEREYLCTVFVGDVQVVEVAGGVSPESVETEAAQAAVKILEAKKARNREMNVDKTQVELTEDVEMKE